MYFCQLLISVYRKIFENCFSYLIYKPGGGFAEKIGQKCGW